MKMKIMALSKWVIQRKICKIVTYIVFEVPKTKKFFLLMSDQKALSTREIFTFLRIYHLERPPML